MRTTRTLEEILDQLGLDPEALGVPVDDLDEVVAHWGWLGGNLQVKIGGGDALIRFDWAEPRYSAYIIYDDDSGRAWDHRRRKGATVRELGMRPAPRLRWAQTS